MTLRVRLVVVLVALVAAGLFGTWLVGSQVMERYLLGQLDARLDRAVTAARPFLVRENMILRDANGVLSGNQSWGVDSRGDGRVCAGQGFDAGVGGGRAGRRGDRGR
jgi:two-component system, OmpR family, sensor kinase